MKQTFDSWGIQFAPTHVGGYGVFLICSRTFFFLGMASRFSCGLGCLFRRLTLCSATEFSQRENRYHNYGSHTARQNLLGGVMVFVTFQVVPMSVFVATGVQAVRLVELCTM